MSAPVFVGSNFVAKYPEGGGNFWVPLQYVLGLCALHIDAYWLELLPGTGDAVQDKNRIAEFFSRTMQLGIGRRALVLYMPDSENYEINCPPDLSTEEILARMREGVLLNLANSIPSEFRHTFALKVLYDIDPGMFQLWAAEWGMGVGDHDLYFTIGQSVGEFRCTVPTLGVEWHRVWPVVHLPAWPVQITRAKRYTTITQWWNGNSRYDIIDDEVYDHNKRTSFLDFLDIPHRTKLEFELAANITRGEMEDRAVLEENGWKLVHPHAVASSPWSYRNYVQSSRGEFSCAKPSVVKISPGWISDRTVCYLASGRPCVVQAAGAQHHLPENLGLQFFTTKSEAVEALQTAERDYYHACTSARELAEEFFSTAVVLRDVINIIGL